MQHEQQAHAPSVGHNVLRQEGREKLTGEARYVDDLSYPGMLYGKTIRSTLPHALIKYINFDPVFDWSRVVIADYHDIPGRNVVILIEDDQPLLAERKVKHAEEPILLLAAEDRELLEEAARHVHIEYEPLPAIFSMDDALARKQVLYKQDNIFKRICITKGDVLRGLSKSDQIIEGTYRVGPQEQLYIEPQGMIAIPGEDGTMIVEGSTQCPYYVHRALKHILDLPDDKVIVRQTVTGGGFGGKEEYPDMLAGHAAVLARKAGRPVKMVYDRVEDLSATTKRHPARIHHRTGVSRDGRLMSMLIDIVMDGGAYCTLSPVVLSRGAIHAAGPYNCDNLRIEAKVVATNHPPYGAFRGFGVPQVCFAVEQQMDQIAESLGIDPLTLRQINLLRQGDRTATGQRLDYSVGSDQVLHTAVTRANYHQLVRRYRRQTGTKRRGVGLSFFYHGAGFTGSGELNMRSGAAVELRPDGTASIYTGTTEIGQGTRTIFCQIVADELGLPYERVFIENADTSRVPDSGPTVASRTCMIIGGVLQRCASELKHKLTVTAAEAIGVSVETIKIEHDHILCIDAPVMTLADAVNTHVERYGPLRVFQRYDPPPGMHWDEHQYRGDAYAAYAFGADVAEVEVDLETFEVKVLRVTSVADVGRAIHPILAEGQIEGGTLQAVGYAVMEEVVMQQGRMINNRLTNYLIPTAVDAPEINAILVESPYPFGPFGAKGIGELPMDGGAPAIASAISQATGLRITELPITPERLHQAACQAAGQNRNRG